MTRSADVDFAVRHSTIGCKQLYHPPLSHLPKQGNPVMNTVTTDGPS
jgi:hypothetical protein